VVVTHTSLDRKEKKKELAITPKYWITNEWARKFLLSLSFLIAPYSLVVIQQSFGRIASQRLHFISFNVITGLSL
jgi:hypothetical protein